MRYKRLAWTTLGLPVAMWLGAAAGWGLSACQHSARLPESGPRRVLMAATGADAGAAAAPPVFHWIDVSDAGPLVGAFPAIARHFDAVFIPDGGLPGYLPDGGLDYVNVTLHDLAPIAHCYQQGRYALPLRTDTLHDDAAEALRLRADCVAVVDAGQSTTIEAICADVLKLAVSTTLDATWVSDGGPCWWTLDGGAPPAPPDLFDGSTP